MNERKPVFKKELDADRLPAFQVSLRSYLILTASVAVLAWFFANWYGSQNLIFRLVLWMLAWIAPFSSLGYDRVRCSSGAIIGGFCGFVFSLLTPGLMELLIEYADPNALDRMLKAKYG